MNNIIDLLINYDNFLIISHVSPDGDTLGSAAALCLALESVGKKVILGLDAEVPKKLSFLNKLVKFYKPDDINAENIQCAIAVDTATKKRMGRLADIFSCIKIKINIDHHLTNEKFAHENLIVEKASTGEIIFDLLNKLNISITEDIADCLFAAISTDTNNFVYSSVTADTFYTAAKLSELGASISELCEQIYYKRSFGATRLISLGLSRIKLFCNGKISATYMCLKDIEECGAKREDCDVLVNYCREIDGVEIAIFINEMPDDTFKISLRSNRFVDVSAISVKYGGGGHKRASGHVMSGTVDEILKQMLKDSEEALL